MGQVFNLPVPLGRLITCPMFMPPQFEHIVASDGYRLFARHWRPNGQPRGFVVALHGIQSHSGWYEYSSGRLCEAGYDVLFLDRRGSGRNFSRRR